MTTDRALDFLNLAVAVVAILLAIVEMRRGNSVVLRLRRCQYSGRQAVDENRGQAFSELNIVVANKGISLHAMTATIGFRAADGHGWYTLPVPRIERGGDGDEFARGMVAQFTFKTYKMDKHDRGFLLALQDPGKQDAVLEFWSQGYLAARFQIGGQWDRLKELWNKLAFWVNWNMLTYRWKGMLRTWFELPQLPQLSVHLMDLRKTIERERAESASNLLH